jgi:hypothetical protein
MAAQPETLIGKSQALVIRRVAAAVSQLPL